MEQEHSNKFLIPAAIIVAGGLVAAAIYMGGSATPSVAGAGQQNADVPAVSSKDHLLGDPNAPIVIVEYSDTECPFCKVFHNTIKQVVASYDGKVAWVYRHFPIPQLHSRAMKEAEAIECVASLGGEGLFWKYLDKIFATTNSNDSLDPALLPLMAEDLGVDTAAFNSCLSSGRYTSKIKDSMEEAVEIGARGTPYSIIIAKDGRQTIVNGAEPMDTVKAKIDALLK